MRGKQKERCPLWGHLLQCAQCNLADMADDTVKDFCWFWPSSPAPGSMELRIAAIVAVRSLNDVMPHIITRRRDSKTHSSGPRG